MAELEQLGDEMTAALSTAVAAGIKQLASFRTFCGCVDMAAGIVSGWARPLIYRHAGERTLRVWPLTFITGWLFWALALFALTPISAMLGYDDATALIPGPLGQIAVVWAVGLAVIDWLAARQRRQAGEFVYSKFLGWPRWAANTWTGYCWQPVGLGIVGLALILCGVDRGSGVLFLGTSLALGAQLWQIAAIRRENALDQLDAGWMAAYQQQAVQSLDAAHEAPNLSSFAQAVTTADLVRHMGTNF